MQKAGKFISGVLCSLFTAAAGLLGFYYALLPGKISVPTGGSTRAAIMGAELKPTADGGYGLSLGAMKIKTVEVNTTERKMLIPGGQPFGIKLRTDGVIVISVNNGSPADKAGIKPGDIISNVNGIPVHTNSEIVGAVQMDSEECIIILSRGSGEMRVKATPTLDGEALRLGAWVRDSAAGIGTLTFSDPDSGMFAGLGHPVSDVTTGELMPLSSGEITDAEIYSVIKGVSGEAGELCGDLCSGSVGKLTANTSVGVFGDLLADPSGEPVPMAFRQEVECGEATILATINGSEPQKYSIEIEKINLCAMNGTKSMVIRVTDERLLEATGGIVRGMSGSPILQNGMLAGAVTHVFLNDPTRGYAVFAESMIEQME